MTFKSIDVSGNAMFIIGKNLIGLSIALAETSMTFKFKSRQFVFYKFAVKSIYQTKIVFLIDIKLIRVIPVIIVINYSLLGNLSTATVILLHHSSFSGPLKYDKLPFKSLCLGITPLDFQKLFH